MKTTNPLIRSSVSRSLLPRRSAATLVRRRACHAVGPQRRDEGGSRLTFLPLALALCCFALCSTTLEAVTPAPDGAYTGSNTAEGQNALFSLTSGIWNTALGYQALYHDTTGNFNSAEGMNALFNNTTGHHNTASGVQTLYSDTTGSFNTATGTNALYHNTTASNNTATGYTSLYSTTTGSDNTANGFQALYKNTTGNDNTASGSGALFSNTTGVFNTANGFQALYKNTTGNDNTATGRNALYNNTIGAQNTANGDEALFHNTTGANNTATGHDTLQSNTTGNNNTAIGEEALINNTSGGTNTASGVDALGNNTTGNGNIALGFEAGVFLTAGDNNIDIGNQGAADDANTIRIGDSANQFVTFIAGIYNVNEGGTPLAVYINENGQLGTMSSSRRFKKEIKPMDQTSEAILALKPVTFHYKSDSTNAPQFGLIAEDVEKVDSDLVVRDAKGEIYSVRYDAVNAMLLNEFLKEHRKVEEQQATIAELKSAVAKQEAIAALQQKEIQTLTVNLKEQAALIQKVNARFDVIKSAPQTVLNVQ